MSNSLVEQSKLLNSVAILGTTGSLSINSVSIPSTQTLPWLIPENLILEDIHEVSADTKTYIWNNQDIPLYNLTDKKTEKVNMLLIESVIDMYRFGILYEGSLNKHIVKLSDIKDSKTKQEFPYVISVVKLQDNYKYIVPALDKLSHELIDLDR